LEEDMRPRKGQRNFHSWMITKGPVKSLDNLGPQTLKRH
jgi:hypothetical protein